MNIIFDVEKKMLCVEKFRVHTTDIADVLTRNIQKNNIHIKTFHFEVANDEPAAVDVYVEYEDSNCLVRFIIHDVQENDKVFYMIDPKRFFLRNGEAAKISIKTGNVEASMNKDDVLYGYPLYPKKIIDLYPEDIKKASGLDELINKVEVLEDACGNFSTTMSECEEYGGHYGQVKEAPKEEDPVEEEPAPQPTVTKEDIPAAPEMYLRADVEEPSSDGEYEEVGVQDAAVVQDEIVDETPQEEVEESETVPEDPTDGYEQAVPDTQEEVQESTTTIQLASAKGSNFVRRPSIFDSIIAEAYEGFNK